jgi:hypothetical protein
MLDMSHLVVQLSKYVTRSWQLTGVLQLVTTVPTTYAYVTLGWNSHVITFYPNIDSLLRPLCLSPSDNGDVGYTSSMSSRDSSSYCSSCRSLCCLSNAASKLWRLCKHSASASSTVFFICSTWMENKIKL